MIGIPVNEQIIIDCASKWSNTTQLFVAVEECGEFIQAAMKYENRKGAVEHLIAESADVLFLMLQLRYIVGEGLFDEYLAQTINKVSRKLYENQ
jgi:NTP pyrophosphatase (non-canonical NTP hydrolase)